MSTSYFAIECGTNFRDHAIILDPNGNPIFEELLDMSYNEMTEYEKLDDFVVAAMDAANSTFGTKDERMVVTLIGDDDVFIWSIIMGPGEEDTIRYVFVNWMKDGKKYRYES